jgi:hypothetical protein
MSEAYKRPKRVIPVRDDIPMYTQGMAAAFFDLTPETFRAKEVHYGKTIEIRRSPAGTRMYSLNDILRIAHFLRKVNKMTDRQLRLIVLRVDAFKEPIKKHRMKYRKGNNPHE